LFGPTVIDSVAEPGIDAQRDASKTAMTVLAISAQRRRTTLERQEPLQAMGSINENVRLDIIFSAPPGP
jgi:hypothetical protein